MTTPNAAEEFMSLDQHPEIEQELRRRLLTQGPSQHGRDTASAISEMREIFDRPHALESQQSENTER